MADRRDSRRARLALSCTLKHAAGSPIWAETIDVSEGGMSVRAARPLQEDETVDFDLSDADVHGRARVLRHPSPRVYGLRFESLAGPGRDRFMTLLETHRSAWGATRV